MAHCTATGLVKVPVDAKWLQKDKAMQKKFRSLARLHWNCAELANSCKKGPWECFSRFEEHGATKGLYRPIKLILVHMLATLSLPARKLLQQLEQPQDCLLQSLWPSWRPSFELVVPETTYCFPSSAIRNKRRNSEYLVAGISSSFFYILLNDPVTDK